MKVQKTYTFILSRNFGHPITFHLEARRAHAYLAGFLLVLTLLVLLSLMFLFQYPRVQDMHRKLDEMEREQADLREQVFSANQHAFHAKDVILTRASLQDAVESEEDAPENYLPPVDIRSITPRVQGGTLMVTCRLVSQGGSARGGYLFFIFEKQDDNPPYYASSPRAATNERGFPEHYKAGIPFSLISRNQTYQGMVKLRSSQDYFTHVTVYLFSARGGFLAKERLELDREIFVGGRVAT